jgi:hypothetical protein
MEEIEIEIEIEIASDDETLEIDDELLEALKIRGDDQ